MKKFNKMIYLTIFMIMILPTQAFAVVNYGENFGRFALNQIFWVVIVVLVLALIGCVSKRNTTGFIISFIIGVLIIAIIKFPEQLSTMGETLWNVIHG